MHPLARHGDVGSDAGDASDGGSDGCLVRRGGIDRARPRTRSDRAHRGPVPIDHPHGAGGRHGPLHRVRDDPRRRDHAGSRCSSRSSRRCSRPTRSASSRGTCRRPAACTRTSAAGSARSSAGSWPGRSRSPSRSSRPPCIASFGLFGAAFITELTGFENDMLWLPLAVLCGLIVWFLIYRGISVSTRAGRRPRLDRDRDLPASSPSCSSRTPTARSTPSVFIPANGDYLPAFQGMVFCLLAFVGFEAAAPLGEETREPKRTIPRAVILSALLIGLFYIFCYYAATVYFGPDKMQADFLGVQRRQPVGRDGRGSAAGHRQPARDVRDHQQLARQRERRGDRLDPLDLLARPRPAAAASGSRPCTRSTGRRSTRSTSRAIFAIVLAVGLGLLFAGVSTGGPLTTYVFIGYALGLLFAGMYIAVNVAAIGFYLGERRDEFNVLKHLVVPVLGVLVMIPAFLVGAGRADDPVHQRRGPRPDRAVQLRAAARGRLDGRRHRALLLAALAGTRTRSPRSARSMGESEG